MEILADSKNLQIIVNKRLADKILASYNIAQLNGT